MMNTIPATSIDTVSVPHLEALTLWGNPLLCGALPSGGATSLCLDYSGTKLGACVHVRVCARGCMLEHDARA